jgi:5,10-methylenetetrahydromethanopterin reductase
MMRFGIIDLPNVADTGLAVYAEEHGFDAYWVGDNPMMWSDPFMTLALAAERTQTITLGAGVAVTGVRSVPTVAQAMGSLNLLAPRRVVCGIGTGHSAMRVLGHDPMLQRDYRDWAGALKPLLAGGEATLRWNGRETPIHQLMELARGHFSFEPPIPLLVSGFGPKSLGTAGRYGDGILGYLGSTEEEIENTWRLVEDGASAVGRTIDRSEFFACMMTMICVLRDGEDVDSPRIREQAGPVAMLAVHYSYEVYRQLGTAPPPFMAEFWDEYVAVIDRVPEERRHLRIHQGHQNWVPEEDRRFVTPQLIDGTCIVAKPEQIADQMQRWAASGIDEVAVTPAPDTAREVVRDLAELVMPLVKPSPVGG